jgi:hypothetical protein
MLDDLLEAWDTSHIASTREISLWDQVDSELEARFLKVLEDWARQSAPDVSLVRGGVVNGKRVADLRINREDGGVAHWQVTLQKANEGTIPDVVFQRVDDTPLEVDVYLDGYFYHAKPGRDRLADDADKRARLRAEGHVVFQLDSYDVDAMAAGQHEAGDPSWHPYQGNAQMRARTAYQQLGGDPARLADLVWCTPVRTLFAFLTAPDPDQWRRAATAVVAGLLAHPGGVLTGLDSSNFQERLRSALYGKPIPPGDPAARLLARVNDASGCPVTVILDQRDRDASAPLGWWTALAVIDDRHATMTADEEAHKKRWAAWLYWGNLVQFLTGPRGDGAHLAYTGLEDFDPATLAAAGGTGFLSSYGPLGSQASAGVSALELSLATASTSGGAGHVASLPDVAWGNAAYLAPGAAVLAHQLAALGVPEPADEQFGYELGSQGWQAEIAWPDERVAVIVGDVDAVRSDTLGSDAETDGCLAAYAAAGGMPGWPGTGRRRSWQRGSREGTDERAAAHAGIRSEGDRQAAPVDQGRDLRLPAQVPAGPE